MDFFAGGGAAIMAITIMHPVDVVKTKLQFQGENGSSSGKYNGVFKSLIKIGKLEGLEGLYRGISAAYMLQASVTATRFGVYGVAKQYLDDGSDQNKNAKNFVTAALAGFVGALFGNTWFALKTRAQAYSSAKALAVGTQHKPQGGLMSQFVRIGRDEGFKGYFRGIEAFAPRVIAYGAFQLASYDAVKPLFIQYARLEEGLFLQSVAAFVASTISVVAIQPFDFIATRLMNQSINPLTGKGLLYNGPVDCLVKSIKSEGLFCLAKGSSANMTRMGPYTVFVLVFFEQIKLKIS